MARGGRDDQFLVRHRLLHGMEDPLVGGDDEGPVRHFPGRLHDLRGRPHAVRQFDDGGRGFRVHQHGGLRVLHHQVAQAVGLELFVHDAGAVPDQHVGAGDALDVMPEVPVGREQDLFALRVQVRDHVLGDAGGHHPVRARLHGGRGVRVNHHGAVGVLIAERRELVGRAAQVQRAGGLQGGHQHALVGRQDLGRLAHELDAGHDQGLRRVVVAEARHLQRVADNAAGFLGQVLHRAVGVVVGDQHGVFTRQVVPDPRTQFPFALRRQFGLILVREVVPHQLADFQQVFVGYAHRGRMGAARRSDNSDVGAASAATGEIVPD